MKQHYNEERRTVLLKKNLLKIIAMEFYSTPALGFQRVNDVTI